MTDQTEYQWAEFIGRGSGRKAKVLHLVNAENETLCDCPPLGFTPATKHRDWDRLKTETDYRHESCYKCQICRLKQHQQSTEGDG